MNSQRFRLILLAVFAGCVLLFAALCFEGNAILKQKSNQMVNLKLQNKVADAQLSSLVATKKEIEKYSYFKSVAASVIPNDKNQAQAVFDINEMAAKSNLLLQDITFPASTLGGKTSASATAPTAITPTSVSAPDATSNLLSQAVPVPGMPGLYSIQLTITPQTNDSVPSNLKVTYPKILDFLNRIENDRRTAQITQCSIQSSEKGIDFSITVNIFIKP